MSLRDTLSRDCRGGSSQPPEKVELLQRVDLIDPNASILDQLDSNAQKAPLSQRNPVS